MAKVVYLVEHMELEVNELVKVLDDIDEFRMEAKNQGNVFTLREFELWFNHSKMAECSIRIVEED